MRRAARHGHRVVAALLVAIASTIVRAADDRATSWTEMFSTERDTVLFIGADGSLIRAPFDLSSRESLWVARGRERLTRVRVSPDGRTSAWITRAIDGDTTRLWIGSGREERARVRFFPVRPPALGVLHFEPPVPTVQDPDYDGARLVVPGVMMRRFSANSLEWMPDGSSVVFGTSDGIAAAPRDSGGARVVAPILAIDLTILDPSPLHLTHAVVAEAQGKGREDWLLVYPTLDRWRLFPASGLELSRPWSAGPATVWWASGNAIRSVGVSDPTPRIEARVEQPVSWLRYSESRGVLEWAAGSRIFRRKPGDSTRVVLDLPAEVKTVLERRETGNRGLVVGKSLVLWRPTDDSTRVVPLGSFSPTDLFEVGGVLLLASRDGPRVARLDVAGGTLEPVATPKLKHAILAASPGRRFLIAAEGGAEPARTLHVLDPVTSRWTEVANPGISGWERMAPR